MDILKLAADSPESIRIAFLTTVNLCIYFTIILQVLERRHSIGWYIGFLVIRVVFFKTLVLGFFGEYIAADRCLLILAILWYFIENLIMIALFWYTFKGSLIRTVLYTSLTDLFVSIVGAVNMGLSQFIAGKENIFSITGRIGIPDMITTGLTILEILLIVKKCQMPLKWLRNYQLKYLRFWCVFVIIYYIGMIFFAPIQQIKASSLKAVFLNVFVWGMLLFVIIIAICVYIWSSYKQQIVYNHRMLKKQQMLMISHVKAVQQQIQKLERSRLEANKRMKQILSEESQGQENEQISSYLCQLKEQYSSIRAGMYCKDWLVDAALFYMADKFDKEGTSYEISFQEYDRGEISSEDIAQMLLQLLGLKRTGKVTLKAKGSGDELFFKVTGLKAGRREIKKAIGYFIGKYKAQIWLDSKSEEPVCMIRVIKKEI